MKTPWMPSVGVIMAALLLLSATAWLADPGATQEIVLKGCDAVSDVCVLGAVSHGGVSGKLVIGYGRR
jgi:hypothetical protein